MNWRDELKQQSKTPIEIAAEETQAEAEAQREALQAVASAQQQILKAFSEAQKLLVRRNPQFSYTSMNDSTLAVGGRVLSARRSTDGLSLTVSLDAKDERLVFNRLKRCLVLESAQRDDLDLDEFIGTRIKSIT